MMKMKQQQYYLDRRKSRPRWHWTLDLTQMILKTMKRCANLKNLRPGSAFETICARKRLLRDVIVSRLSLRLPCLSTA